MAYVEEAIHTSCGIPTFSSPRYGAEALKNALIDKGVIEKEKCLC